MAMSNNPTLVSPAPRADGPLMGRVAFVTGAARGQGRAACVRLARDGADIIALDACAPIPTSHVPPATPDDLAETVRLVTAEGRRIVATQSDVRDLDQVQATVTDGVREFGGRLDIVLANAGILSIGRTWELSAEQWQTMLDVNLTGVWHTIRAAIPLMIAAGNGGSVILTSSIAGTRGLPYEAHYVAAKHGVVGLVRALAIEVGEYGIRVNSIHPNGVDTAMAKDSELGRLLVADGRLLGLVATALPNSLQQPEEVAATIAWLAGDESRFMTGEQVHIGSGNQLM